MASVILVSFLHWVEMIFRAQCCPMFSTAFFSFTTFEKALFWTILGAPRFGPGATIMLPSALCGPEKFPKRLQHVFVSFKAENGKLRLPPKHFKIMARKKDILVWPKNLFWGWINRLNRIKTFTLNIEKIAITSHQAPILLRFYKSLFLCACSH